MIQGARLLPCVAEMPVIDEKTFRVSSANFRVLHYTSVEVQPSRLVVHEPSRLELFKLRTIEPCCAVNVLVCNLRRVIAKSSFLFVFFGCRFTSYFVLFMEYLHK